MAKLEIFASGVNIKNSRSGISDGWGVFFADNSPRNAAGPVAGNQDSNTGDLVAIQEALKIILEDEDDKEWVIKTNSDEAIKTVTVLADKWEDNDFKNDDGSPVPNQVFIEAIRGDLSEAKSKGYKISFDTADPHSSYGITRADQLARVGAHEGHVKAHGVNDNERGHYDNSDDEVIYNGNTGHYDDSDEGEYDGTAHTGRYDSDDDEDDDFEPEFDEADEDAASD